MTEASVVSTAAQQRQCPTPEDRATETEAAHFLGFAPATLRVDRCRPRFHFPFHRIGRKIFYSKAELREWQLTNAEAGGRVGAAA